MRILLVEDDEASAQFVCAGLEARGHRVDVEPDSRSALVRASSTPCAYQVLIVDRMLPGLDGLTLVKTLRTAGVSTPALFLTALGGVADRVEGLRHGGDDYLVKPFDIEELDARLGVLNRRVASAAETVLQACGLKLDRLNRRVAYEGAAVELTASEFRMLEILMLNAGRHVTKAVLLEAGFNIESHAPEAIIEPHISRLRRKLQRAGVSDPIRTHRGAGYSIPAR